MSADRQKYIEREVRRAVRERLGEVFINTYDDGSIRFRPAYPKDFADYRTSGDDDFDTGHEHCASCTHYIPPKDGEVGGCHLVQGSIDPHAYCAQFYSDTLIAAHEHEGSEGIEVNHVEFSPDEFDWDGRDATEFALDVREIIEQEIRHRMGLV